MKSILTICKRIPDLTLPALLWAAVAIPSGMEAQSQPASTTPIKHVVVIFQEKRASHNSPRLQTRLR